MTPQQTHVVVTLVLLALIAWRLQARIRRMITRQRLSTMRPWMNVVLFPLLIAVLALGSHMQPLAQASLAGGAALGAALGIIGLRLTRFEVSAEGLYYTPSAHIGVVLSVLLVCRIAWRFLRTGFQASPVAPSGAVALTPLTLALLGTLAGYYFAYAVGLLRWAAKSRSLSPKPQAPS